MVGGPSGLRGGRLLDLLDLSLLLLPLFGPSGDDLLSSNDVVGVRNDKRIFCGLLSSSIGLLLLLLLPSLLPPTAAAVVAAAEPDAEDRDDRLRLSPGRPRNTDAADPPRDEEG